MLALAKRNFKEILRDPLSLGFGLGFPIVIIVLLSAIQANVPVDLFNIQLLAPGAMVFGLSFLTLFSALTLAKDRSSAFLTRLYASPLRGADFICAYTLPMIPMALMQAVISFIAAFIFGFKLSVNLLLALALVVPASFMYVAMGLLFGSILTEKQVGGVCGALLTNLSAWLSGIWFDVQLVGGAFKTLADILPFSHAVEMERAAVNGDFAAIGGHLAIVAAYAAGLFALAVFLFLRQMKRQ